MGAYRKPGDIKINHSSNLPAGGTPSTLAISVTNNMINDKNSDKIKKGFVNSFSYYSVFSFRFRI